MSFLAWPLDTAIAASRKSIVTLKHNISFNPETRKLFDSTKNMHLVTSTGSCQFQRFPH